MPSRPVFHLVVLFALLLSPGTIASPSRSPSPPPDPDALVVHEWGTLTSIAGREGSALEWRPLSGGADEDLPSFVHSLSSGEGQHRFRHPPKSDLKARIRMETPVLYFYADRETEVSVKVDFPRGQVTEWYPQARTVSGGIDWGRIKVMPGLSITLPTEDRPSHYYPARKTDAAVVSVCGDRETQYEKFLFYRGVGNFNPPLAVKLDGGQVRVSQQGDGVRGQVILFEKRDGKTGYVMQRLQKGETVLPRPAREGTIDGLLADLRAALISEGLYEREAEAMLETWRDSWFEEGLRIFYVLPRRMTDELLPIIIEPRPKELVRVLVVRTEIITPEMESTLLEQMRRLTDPRRTVRREAAKELLRYGRFTEPVLRQLLGQTNDPGVRARIETLLGRLNRQKEEALSRDK